MPGKNPWYDTRTKMILGVIVIVAVIVFAYYFLHVF
jgi:hypothetical protein